MTAYQWRGVPEEDWEKYEQENRLARDTYHAEKASIDWRYDTSLPRGRDRRDEYGRWIYF